MASDETLREVAEGVRPTLERLQPLLERLRAAGALDAAKAVGRRLADGDAVAQRFASRPLSLRELMRSPAVAAYLLLQVAAIADGERRASGAPAGAAAQSPAAVTRPNRKPRKQKFPGDAKLLEHMRELVDLGATAWAAAGEVAPYAAGSTNATSRQTRLFEHYQRRYGAGASQVASQKLSD